MKGPLMNKRDLVFSVFDPHSKPDYIPAAFFLHFDPAHHHGPAAVDKHLEYFRYTGMDFVKIQFEQPFPRLTVIQNPEDWDKLPFFKLDHYEPMLNVVSGLVKAAKAEAPVILTLYSPYMLTNEMVGAETVTRHIQENPAAYQRGIGRITESLLLFVRECIRLGLDGFYTSTQGGEYGRLTDSGSFETCIRPYDLAIMNEVNQSCPFNILHVCDYNQPYGDLARFKDYPGTVVNTSLELVGKEITAQEVARLFGRPFMGGLERKGTIQKGTPEQIRAAVKDAVAKAPDRYILGADCTVPAETPWDNLRLAIQTAHEARR
jgi:uroporphyrinogen decarboxylase